MDGATCAEAPRTGQASAATKRSCGFIWEELNTSLRRAPQPSALILKTLDELTASSGVACAQRCTACANMSRHTGLARLRMPRRKIEPNVHNHYTPHQHTACAHCCCPERQGRLGARLHHGLPFGWCAAHSRASGLGDLGVRRCVDGGVRGGLNPLTSPLSSRTPHPVSRTPSSRGGRSATTRSGRR